MRRWLLEAIHIWVSATRPGRTQDITAARHDHITAHPREAGVGALADLGFLGLDDDPDNPVVITSHRAARGRRLTTEGSEQADRPRTRRQRVRLRRPQELAHPHQAPHARTPVTPLPSCEHSSF
ncbi:hypothetical protein RB200_06950 [Streptomyces sp. PmtG]